MTRPTTTTKSRHCPRRQQSLSMFSSKFFSVSSLLLLLLFVVVVIVDGVRIHPNGRHYRDAADGFHRLLWSTAHVPSEEEVWAENKNATAFSAAHAVDQSRTRRTVKTVDVEQATSPQDHLVKNLPLLQDGTLDVDHWAGHLPASANGDKYFFYWLFAPDLGDSAGSDSSTSTPTITDDIPLLIWLNGGPGCSSMDGLFLENGPLQWQPDPTTKQYRLVANPHSWHKAPAYTLYIDQPVGTGLSFTTDQQQGYPTNDEKVNIDFYYFLQSFLTLHTDKFAKNNRLRRPLYFSGESHAGHYIPSLIHYILKQNDNGTNNNNKNNNIIIPVAGAAIGNGWMDPYHQYAAAEAAYGHGILGSAQVAALREDEAKCQAALLQKQYRSNVCFGLLDDVVDESHGSSTGTRVSQYDVRVSEHTHQARNFPFGHKIVETYLGGFALSTSEHPGTMDSTISNSVLQALHASAATSAGQRYQECTDPPYNALSQWDGLGVVPDVVAILEHVTKPRLLFFNGIQDLICNHVGNEKFLENMEWKFKAEWTTQAKRYAWVSSKEEKDKVSGYVKEYENLLFLKLLNGGHMVPMDIPAVALDMMQVFMQTRLAATTSFDSSLQNLKSKRPQPDDGSCPDCPTCPTSSDEDKDDHDDYSNPGGSNDVTQSKTPAKASSSSRLPWMLVFVLTVAVAIASFLLCRKHGGKEKVEYSLELRSVQRTYTDEPDENGNGENNKQVV